MNRIEQLARISARVAMQKRADYLQDTEDEESKLTSQSRWPLLGLGLGGMAGLVGASMLAPNKLHNMALKTGPEMRHQLGLAGVQDLLHLGTTGLGGAAGAGLGWLGGKLIESIKNSPARRARARKKKEEWDAKMRDLRQYMDDNGVKYSADLREKQANYLLEKLRQAGSSAVSGLHSAGNAVKNTLSSQWGSLQDRWDQLSPETRELLLRSAIGAGAGSLGSLGYSAITRESLPGALGRAAGFGAGGAVLGAASSALPRTQTFQQMLRSLQGGDDEILDYPDYNLPTPMSSGPMLAGTGMNIGNLSKISADLRAKQANLASEAASFANPLNVVGAPLGALAAAITPPRTPRDQAEREEDVWKNVLIPGYGPYNLWKRKGVVSRLEELQNSRPKDPQKREAWKAKMEELRKYMDDHGVKYSSDRRATAQRALRLLRQLQR